MTPTDAKNSSRYALNLTPKMVDSLIVKTEIEITNQKQQQSLLSEDYKAAEEMFLTVKGKWDAFQKVIDEEMATLEALTRFKKSASPNKSIQVYKTISNTHQKEKKKHTPIPWAQLFFDRLVKEDRFFNINELVDLIIRDNNILKERNFNKKQIYSFRYYMAVLATKGEKHFRLFNEMIGLDQFFEMGADLTMQPKLKYLNQFLPNTSNL